MRIWRCTLLLVTSAFVGCGTHRMVSGEALVMTSALASAVDNAVRAFMGTVAHDVTQDGPAAWQTHFENTPAFFMAVDGQLVFPNREVATQAIQGLTHTIKHIELQWGDDLRVDPLTANLAVVASSWHEVLVDAAEKSVDEKGFFTGIVEYGDGRWQLRNAHWSGAAASPPIK